ncbi:hypothetical protein ACIF6L_14200 [Kitasatospora sp. NPDC086009]|uniref:hypothetical protein n=1 Tax=unclassified Kitasatospora TaxID=2633591 RepID=UPI0037C5E3F9
MVEHWPAYEEYQAKSDREIPVVLIEPTAFGRPPGGPAGRPGSTPSSGGDCPLPAVGSCRRRTDRGGP